MPNPHGVISPAEAERAIYIDPQFGYALVTGYFSSRRHWDETGSDTKVATVNGGRPP